MTWLLAGATLLVLGVALSLLEGRNRTPGDRLNGPNWFDQARTTGRAARRAGRRRSVG